MPLYSQQLLLQAVKHSPALPCQSQVSDTCSFQKLPTPTPSSEGFSAVGQSEHRVFNCLMTFWDYKEKKKPSTQNKTKEPWNNKNKEWITIQSINSADRNYQKNNGYLPLKRVLTEVSYCMFLWNRTQRWKKRWHLFKLSFASRVYP